MDSDEFLKQMEIVIDTGNIKLLQSIIILYKNKIDNNLIKAAETILDSLLNEQIEELTI